MTCFIGRCEDYLRAALLFHWEPELQGLDWTLVFQVLLQILAQGQLEQK